MKCKICKNETDNQLCLINEMMFGFNEKFEYFQCSKCNCLQILIMPENISKYYPDDYYTHLQRIEQSWIYRFLSNKRDKYGLFGTGFTGRVLWTLFPRNDLYSLTKIPLNTESKIIDIGCGSGDLLRRLNRLGFKNLVGIDKYTRHDQENSPGMNITQVEIQDIDDSFDIIMFHHSFEHISEPADVFGHISRLLKPNGFCILRIPVVPSFAWQHYGVHWVQIDAPRHFFIHSKESITILSHQSGLYLDSMYYDSESLQFWGSELYKMGVFLSQVDKNKYFTKIALHNFEKKAKRLNIDGLGDQAVFYLKKQNPSGNS